ncbi:MAG: GDP-mannose 4,6-dehydratase [Pseudomonadota bacterium]
MTILVEGGASANGARFVIRWLREVGESVINVDSLASATALDSLECLAGDPRHVFVLGDLSERRLLDALLLERQPRAVIYFISQSDAGSSLHSSAARNASQPPHTAIVEAARAYWHTLSESRKTSFRFASFAGVDKTVELSGSGAFGASATGDAMQTIALQLGLAPMEPMVTRHMAGDQAMGALMAALCESPEDPHLTSPNARMFSMWVSADQAGLA